MQAPSPAYSSSSLYAPDSVANSGPIISDITELAPASPVASPGGSIDERWGPHHPSHPVPQRGEPLWAQGRVGDEVGLAKTPANVAPLVSRPLSSSPLVRVKEEPPSPPQSPRVEEASPGRPSSVDTLLSPTALIDSILRESEPTPASATALTDARGHTDTEGQPPSPLPTSTPEKCLSVACLDK